MIVTFLALAMAETHLDEVALKSAEVFMMLGFSLALRVHHSKGTEEATTRSDGRLLSLLSQGSSSNGSTEQAPCLL